MSNATQPAPTPPPAAKRMSLAAVKKGKLVKPARVVLYGTEGIGKSTFASEAPNPIFVCAEDGTKELDVARYPEPRTWDEVTEAVEELRTSKHDYQTFVLDTLDWAEPLVWAKVSKDAKKKDIEDFDFGKGYTAAIDVWRSFLSRLDALSNEREMHIVLLAHAHIRKFQNPEGNDFDRYEMKLHAKSSGVIREWCDALLFAKLEILTHDVKKRTKGIDSGARLVHTNRRAAYDAKNRYSLPDQFPLSWSEFATAMKAGAPAEVEKLRGEITELLALVDEKNRAQASDASVRAGDDAKKLAQLVNWLRGKIEVSDKKESAQ